MRNIITVVGLVAAVGLAMAPACASDEVVTDQPSGKVTVVGATGGGGTLGVGEPCGSTDQCRAGLVCDPATSTCAPGHTLPAGSPCAISGECADGLYCAEGLCAAAGVGASGASCGSDADCGAGLHCVLVGFGAQCLAEGTGDVGATCATSADCFGGLHCEGGACAKNDPGSAPFESGWKGVTCADESGPAQAYFQVPRGTAADGDFYRLPFPNDVRLDAGKIDLSTHPVPGSDLLGYDIVDRYLRAIESDSDGFGLYHSTILRFSADLDTDTFTGSISLINLTQAKGLSVYYSYSVGGTAYVCKNWVAVRPAQGAPFEEGDTYAVLVKTTLKAKGGAPIQPAADLVGLLGAAAPADAAVAPHWPKYQILRDYLTTAGIATSDILNATVFTVGHPTAPVAKLEAVIDAAPPPAASAWTRCDTGVMSPCPDATGERACPAADPAFDELHARVALPIFQKGTAPYATPDQGGALELDAGGNPVVVRTEDVCLSLTVPKGAPPAAGWPTLVYAHDTGGHFRSHVTSGLAAAFAAGVDDGSGTAVKAAVLGIDQVEHGPRAAGSAASPFDLYTSPGNPGAARGNAQQGAADQMALLRFVPSVVFDDVSSPTGAAFALSPSVALWGHGQGATAGALALPFGAYAGAALSGVGAAFKDVLTTRQTPVDTAAAIPWVLADATADGKLKGGEVNAALSLLQIVMDGADPLAYALRAAKVPPAGAPNHHLFQVYGQGDTDTTPLAQASYVFAAGLGLAAHDASVTAPDDLKLSEIPVPASGNLTVNATPVTAIVRQYAPAAGTNGHAVALNVANADVLRYLAGVLGGGLPVVGN